jgi:xylitol oxidase
VPAFDIRQYVYEDLPWDQLIEHFEDIVGAGYSVCLFTDWREPRINQVWLKLRDDWTPEERWLGSVRADGPRHPVPGMPVANCTEQNGVAGPWFERLPHFRFEFTPSSGDEIQTEYLLPRAQAVEALTALSAVREAIAPALMVTEIRTAAADGLWLSPAYARPTAAIHFTWVDDLSLVTPAVAAVEKALESFEARPHWGKVFGMSRDRVRAMYPRLGDFEQLAQRHDPAGTFANDFARRYLSLS